MLTKFTREELIDAALTWLHGSCGCTTADVSALGRREYVGVGGVSYRVESTGIVTLTCPQGPVRVARQVLV
jgi:hypothetical protein